MPTPNKTLAERLRERADKDLAVIGPKTRRLLREAAAEIEAQEWKPIESAPKDDHLLLADKDGIYFGCWNSEVKQWYGDNFGYDGCAGKCWPTY